MKLSLLLKLTGALVISFLTFAAHAGVTGDSRDQLYSFKFHLKGETYEYQQSANTYEEAYSKAAKACYNHYKAGRHITEEDGLDIIDVCANPRST